MPEYHITKIGKSPTIPTLVSELAQVHAKLDATRGAKGKTEEFERIYNRHWALREKICATPASSIYELSAKARALQTESERDPDFECDAPGCARDLARSIAADLITLADQGGAP